MTVGFADDDADRSRLDNGDDVSNGNGENGDGGELYYGRPVPYEPGDNGGREPEEERDNTVQFPLPGGDPSDDPSGPVNELDPSAGPSDPGSGEPAPGAGDGFEWAPWAIALGLFFLYRYAAGRYVEEGEE